MSARAAARLIGRRRDGPSALHRGTGGCGASAPVTAWMPRATARRAAPATVPLSPTAQPATSVGSPRRSSSARTPGSNCGLAPIPPPRTIRPGSSTAVTRRRVGPPRGRAPRRRNGPWRVPGSKREEFHGVVRRRAVGGGPGGGDAPDEGAGSGVLLQALRDRLVSRAPRIGKTGDLPGRAGGPRSTRPPATMPSPMPWPTWIAEDVAAAGRTLVEFGEGGAVDVVLDPDGEIGRQAERCPRRWRRPGSRGVHPSRRHPRRCPGRPPPRPAAAPSTVRRGLRARCPRAAGHRRWYGGENGAVECATADGGVGGTEIDGENGARGRAEAVDGGRAAGRTVRGAGPCGETGALEFRDRGGHRRLGQAGQVGQLGTGRTSCPGQHGEHRARCTRTRTCRNVVLHDSLAGRGRAPGDAGPRKDGDGSRVRCVRTAAAPVSGVRGPS